MIPPRDWSLHDTGSWYNYFLKRDHTGHPVVPLQQEPAKPEIRKSGPEKS
jgi:hypothetical protein